MILELATLGFAVLSDEEAKRTQSRIEMVNEEREKLGIPAMDPDELLSFLLEERAPLRAHFVGYDHCSLHAAKAVWRFFPHVFHITHEGTPQHGDKYVMDGRIWQGDPFRTKEEVYVEARKVADRLYLPLHIAHAHALRDPVQARFYEGWFIKELE